jgi:hypothetical protein
MYIDPYVKYTLFLSEFSESWISLTDFWKKSNFIKIWLVGAELFHTDGRTDEHDEVNSRFSQFFGRAYNGFIR